MDVVPNDFVWFKTTIIDGLNQYERIPEGDIKAVFVCNGTELCTVGSFPRQLLWLKGRLVSCFAQLNEL